MGIVETIFYPSSNLLDPCRLTSFRNGWNNCSGFPIERNKLSQQKFKAVRFKMRKKHQNLKIVKSLKTTVNYETAFKRILPSPAMFK